LTWRTATLTEIRQETPTIRTLVFAMPGWPGHAGGQHIDVRLTGMDGCQAQRRCSIGSAWTDGHRVECTKVEIICRYRNRRTAEKYRQGRSVGAARVGVANAQPAFR